jgi:acyl-CoA dehydrogenase
MPDQLNDTLAALRDGVAALAQGPLATLRDDAALAPAALAAQVRVLSRAAGLYGLTQDETTPALTLLVARETLARHDAGHLPGLFGPDAGLLAGVAEPLRSTHLAPMLAGDRQGGFAFTEPADAARPSWAAVDGEHLLVSGRKSYVTGGAQAGFVVALVDVEGQGPSLVVIDTDLPGVAIERRFSSLDGSTHAAFCFDAVRVPRTHAIGAPGEGRSRALARISAVRRLVAADALGTALWAVDLAGADLLRERRGGPRAANERLRLRYGGMRIQAYAARSAVYRAARLHDSGADAVNESIAAKVIATETAGQLVDQAIQLVGGQALVSGHPLEAALRRLRALRLAEGETDTLQVNLARGFLDLGKGGL